MKPTYSAVWPKEIPEHSENTKTVWVQIGVGFTNKERIDIRIDSIPIGWDGRIVLFPCETKPKSPSE